MPRTHQRSFGGGEIAPEMLGRIDLNHYQTGLETCKNFYPLPHGPAVNRPGLQFVKEVKNGGCEQDSLRGYKGQSMRGNSVNSWLCEWDGGLYIRGCWNDRTKWPVL